MQSEGLQEKDIRKKKVKISSAAGGIRKGRVMRMKKKLWIGGVFLVAVLLTAYIALEQLGTGSRLWAMLTPHERVELYDWGEISNYDDNYEKKVDPMGCYSSLDMVRYTQSELFGKECRYILRGEIKKITRYTFQSEDLYHACHVIQIQVEKSLYGSCRKGQVVQVLCRWDYSEKNASYQEGSRGVFVVQGQPVLLHMKSAGERVAIGSLHREKSGCYLLIDEDSKELENLNNKKDMIAYWKKAGR